MFNRAVPAPVANRGQCVVLNAIGKRPLRQYDWLFGSNPVVSACRHSAISPAETLAHSYEMRVIIESHIDALCRMP